MLLALRYPFFANLLGKVNYSGIQNAEKNNGNDILSTGNNVIQSVQEGRIPFTTWRIGAFLGATSSILVLLINIGAAIAAGVRQRSRDNGLFSGDCDTAKRILTVTHIIINILSILLLGASNYCTQILTAPTRRDVDKAHKDGKWLDIGVVSIRNLFYLSKGRLFLAIILMLSSVPIKLFYNSTVYLIFQTNQYSINIVSQSQSEPYLREHPGNLSLSVLEPRACLAAYTESFLSKYSNLTLVFDTDGTRLPYPSQYQNIGTVSPSSLGRDPPFSWICANSRWKNATIDNCLQDEILKSYDLDQAWNIWGQNVRRCIAVSTEERCEIGIGIPLMVGVILSNLVKVIAIITTILLYGDQPILVTIGDAFATFLDRPDEFSKGMCFITQYQIRYNGLLWLFPAVREPRKFRKKPAGWWKAVGRRRWWAVFTLGLICSVASSVYIGDFARGLELVGLNITRIPLGKVDVRNLSTAFYDSFLQIVLIANSPQLLISLFYLLYNGIFTKMALSSEIDKFYKERKYLRVSKPTGQQRSSFFLELPYRFSVPLMAVSTSMHWLSSQTLFLVSINEWDTLRVSEIRRDVLGYSPIGLLLCVVVLLVSILVSLVIGYLFKNDGVVPAVGSSSAAIGAICHCPDIDTNASLSAVMWGVPSIPKDARSTIELSEASEDGQDTACDQEVYDGQVVGHCCLTSLPVTLPIEGSYYQ
ncbi:hypothetical protein H072_11087 [Dactylellina haptotyla CBS 200.50]|uniref:DUF6536 domain-containing protein n=1 Tax=Dactylellina haptotyla (strain CBS 200.50) TaxID=1284197 RepID=S8B8Z4_DACHA|nr:hypothetical protein H072_11087 [Dactylellina haptotyla CBS 200.50]